MESKFEPLRVSGVVKESITDGAGLRYVIFFQGCKFQCKGCHNPDTWDLEGGKLKSVEELFTDIKRNPLLSGVTFSGGEPFLQAEKLLPLAKLIKTAGYNLAIYTGYTLEELQDLKDKSIDALLEIADILVDGRFIEELCDLSLKFKGSSNQRLIDMNKTRKSNKIVITDW